MMIIAEKDGKFVGLSLAAFIALIWQAVAAWWQQYLVNLAAYLEVWR